MNNKFKNACALGGFIIAVIASVGVLLFSNQKEESIVLSQIDTAISSEQSGENILPEEKKMIVYILGAVHEPGIVKVKENARMYEVLLMAGGATEDADLTKVNLASIVGDGQKILIPYRTEKEKVDSMQIQNHLDDAWVETKEVEIIPFELDYGKEYFESVVESDDLQNGGQVLINLNTASESELTKLKGIGQATAKKIIDYRNEVGFFQSIEDIKNVKGIGEAKFQKIKEQITV